ASTRRLSINRTSTRRAAAHYSHRPEFYSRGEGRFKKVRRNCRLFTSRDAVSRGIGAPEWFSAVGSDVCRGCAGFVEKSPRSNLKFRSCLVSALGGGLE